jgi:hypothetical protein
VEESILSKLSRYETAIERQLYRALHKLERRQAARRGAALTPPVSGRRGLLGDAPRDGALR